MNWKDIKTRRQLTQYLYGQLSSGAWGEVVLANFNSPSFWTDEPVSEMEVAAAIREARRDSRGGSPESKGPRKPTQLAQAGRSRRPGQKGARSAMVEAEEGNPNAFESAAISFAQLITEYVNSHPDYQYPSRTRHPAILALGSVLQGWLIDRLGRSDYLYKLADAARHWFLPDCDRWEFRTFCNMFEGFANVGWGNLPEYRSLSERYVAWKRCMLTRNRRRFLVDDLRETQKKNFAQDFSHLVVMCGRRFVSSAVWLDVEKSEIDKVAAIGTTERVELGALHWAATEIWERIVRIYDQPQQGDLFNGWPDAPETLWNRYFYRDLVPALVLDDEVVRNLLNAVGALTVKARVDACEAVRQRFAKVLLPHFAC